MCGVLVVHIGNAASHDFPHFSLGLLVLSTLSHLFGSDFGLLFKFDSCSSSFLFFPFSPSHLVSLFSFVQLTALYLCPHSFPRCDTCLEDVFGMRPVARCPTCASDRRRVEYLPHVFESGEVHREVHVRQHDVADFRYVGLDDMPGETPKERLAAYNDYLEAVEDIAYNLSYHEDEAQTRVRMAQLFAEWETVIRRNEQRAKAERLQRDAERRVRQP